MVPAKVLALVMVEAMGTGTGDGTGEGDGHGTGKAAFNVEGFYAAVDSQKQIPYAAIKRKMNVDVTINVMAKLDTNGNLIDVYQLVVGMKYL